MGYSAYWRAGAGRPSRRCAGVPVGDLNTDSGEARGKAVLGAVPPADRPPLACLQHRLCGDRLHIGNMPLAGTSVSCDGEDHGNIGGIDLTACRGCRPPR